ncbi:MAG: penicillin-binding protein 2 [Candidatus Sungbacteria bacterium]|nr:penicillin-binding protein 2 [Candidatus Sungbacteria bacterium]
MAFGKNKTVVPLDPDEILADSADQLHFSSNLEGKMERSIGRFFPSVFLLVVVVGVGYLTWAAADLTLHRGDYFLGKSQENRFFVLPVFPPRGVVYDRFDIPLVVNMPSFGVAFSREKFKEGSGGPAELLASLGALLGKDREYFYDLGFPVDGDIGKMPKHVVLAEDMPRGAVAVIVSEPERFPGVQVFESYKRIYREPLADSHLLGFIGKVSPEDLERQPDLNSEETIGKSGIEAFYDGLLRGVGGKKIVEIDSRGKETRFRFTQNTVEGSKIKLTVDGELERVTYETVQNYVGKSKGGSVVILDPRNGSVRTLVSFPGFDSNIFSNSLSRKEFEAVLENSLAPLFNRAISGEFPSGSTIKPLVAAAALEEKIIDPAKKIYDEGFIEIPNPYKPGERSVFLDWKKHGWVDFYDAIAQSANVYFYMVGGGFKEQKGLGIERIKKYALAFGLGAKLGIDLPGEKAGFIPDPESKKIAEPQDPVWRIGDTYNVSIGQGGVKVTPLQMAALTAAIANGGKLWRPYILDAVLAADGGVSDKKEPQLIRERMVSEDNVKEVIKGMQKTVTSGTARLLSGLPVSAAAKTGTAQAGSGLPHAWVTAFAPVDNPEVAITVMVEHAGEGATVAVPITNEILKWYFEHRK